MSHNQIQMSEARRITRSIVDYFNNVDDLITVRKQQGELKVSSDRFF